MMKTVLYVTFLAAFIATGKHFDLSTLNLQAT